MYLDLTSTHDSVVFHGAGTSFTSIGAKLADSGGSIPAVVEPLEESITMAMRADLSLASFWIIDVGDVTGTATTVDFSFEDSDDGVTFAPLLKTDGSTVTSQLVTAPGTGDQTRYFAHMLHKRTRKWLRPVVTIGTDVTACPVGIYAIRGYFGNSADSTLPAVVLENY